MTLLYLAALIFIAWLYNSFPEDAAVPLLAAAAVSVPLAIAFAAGPFLRPRRWTWIYGIVLIGIGLTSGCTWPMTIPLLIFWIKPETRTWFESPP